jgi:hypothetical protein
MGRRRIAVLGAGLALAGLALLPGRSEALPTGTLTTNSNTTTCPAGYSCQGFRVACPGVGDVTGFWADKPAAAPAKGLVVFFSGSGGNSFWASNFGGGDATLNQLASEGYRIVQVRWVQAWQSAGTGDGLVAAGCRPATAVKYIHDNLWTPMGVSNAAKTCGFCVSGHSNGSSQATYGPAFYGLAGIIDALIPSSGPTYGAVLKGCLGQDPNYDYAGAVGGASSVDTAWGYGSSGPCSTHNPTKDGVDWQAVWTANGLATGGSYSWPLTRVELVDGTLDQYRYHAMDVRDRLQTAGDDVTWTQIAGMSHNLNAAGLQAVHDAIVRNGGGGGTTTTTTGGSTTTTTTTPGTTTTTVPSTTTTTRVTSKTTTTGVKS